MVEWSLAQWKYLERTVVSHYENMSICAHKKLHIFVNPIIPGRAVSKQKSPQCDFNDSQQWLRKPRKALYFIMCLNDAKHWSVFNCNIFHLIIRLNVPVLSSVFKPIKNVLLSLFYKYNNIVLVSLWVCGAPGLILKMGPIILKPYKHYKHDNCIETNAQKTHCN